MKPTHIITDIHHMDAWKVRERQLVGKACVIVRTQVRGGQHLEPEWESLILRVFDIKRDEGMDIGHDGSLYANFYKVKVEKIPELVQDQFVGDFESFSMYGDGQSNQEHIDEVPQDSTEKSI